MVDDFRGGLVLSTCQISLAVNSRRGTSLYIKTIWRNNDWPIRNWGQGKN